MPVMMINKARSFDLVNLMSQKNMMVVIGCQLDGQGFQNLHRKFKLIQSGRLNSLSFLMMKMIEGYTSHPPRGPSQQDGQDLRKVPYLSNPIFPRSFPTAEELELASFR